MSSSLSAPTQTAPAAIGPGDLLTATTEWLSISTVRIALTGEIDASNYKPLVEFVFGHAANSRRLILDLQDVRFFGTEGLSLLYDLDSRCGYADVEWVLIPGAPVSRVLDICDPDRTLPVSDI